MRDNLPKRTAGIYGVCVHTTGSGAATKIEKATHALADPKHVLDKTLDYYFKPDSFCPHWVIGLQGEVVQIAPETSIAWHVGASNRKHYLSGDWRTMVPQSVLKAWEARWPGRKSPWHLFPGPSANGVYIGVELIPVTSTTATAKTPQERFTSAQYGALAKLLWDIEKRHNFSKSWRKSSRLVGHEDLSPIDRPGWDPGAFKDPPWFDWTTVVY